MEVKIIKPSILIRNYLLNEVANYDNEKGLSPEFIVACQEKIKEKIQDIKNKSYDNYAKIISFLYLDHLNLEELNKKLAKPKKYHWGIDDEDIDLDVLLNLIEWDDSIIDILIDPMIAMYGITKSDVKVKFNEEIERKWNPYYKLEKMANDYEHSDYECLKSIIYANFTEKGPSRAIKEMQNIKIDNYKYYCKLVMEILKNFFIYNFVTCKDNEIFHKLKEAILNNQDMVKFYEDLSFVERMKILIIYFEFNYNYSEKNMVIRNTFAKEEEFAEPYIKALTL